METGCGHCCLLLCAVHFSGHMFSVPFYQNYMFCFVVFVHLSQCGGGGSIIFMHTLSTYNRWSQITGPINCCSWTAQQRGGVFVCVVDQKNSTFNSIRDSPSICRPIALSITCEKMIFQFHKCTPAFTIPSPHSLSGYNESINFLSLKIN